jgi:hypothetical protein
MQRHPITPQGRETRGIGTSQPAPRISVISNLGTIVPKPETESQARELPPRISVGDKVRLWDTLYDQYHWHVVTEIITGAHHRIKVDAYGFYISAACVSSHRKGGQR